MAKESRIGQELSLVTQKLTSDVNAIDLSTKTSAKSNQTLLSFNQLLSQVINSVKEQVIELNSNANSFIQTKVDLENSSTQRQLETDVIATSAEQMAVTVASISEETLN